MEQRPETMDPLDKAILSEDRPDGDDEQKPAEIIFHSADPISTITTTAITQNIASCSFIGFLRIDFLFNLAEAAFDTIAHAIRMIR